MASKEFTGQSPECSIANAFSALLQAHAVIISILQDIGAMISKCRSETIVWSDFQQLQAPETGKILIRSFQGIGLKLFLQLLIRNNWRCLQKSLLTLSARTLKH